MMERTRATSSAAARLAVGALLLIASLGLVSAGPRSAAGAPAAGLAAEVIGEEAVVVSEALSLRDGPGLQAEVIAALPYGTVGTVTDGPVAADGYTWYAFSTADYGAGWVAGEFLAPVVSGGGGFAVGTEVVVAAEDLNLRDAPSTSGTSLAALPLGMPLTIADGPVIADGHAWYAVSFAAQASAGWVAGEFLALAGDLVVFAHGDEVVAAADGLNVRDAPMLGGAVVAQLAAGTGATITGGPLAADGYTWYQIATDAATAGWVAGEILTHP